jgi:hypothetical protein
VNANTTRSEVPAELARFATLSRGPSVGDPAGAPPEPSVGGDAQGMSVLSATAAKSLDATVGPVADNGTLGRLTSYCPNGGIHAGFATEPEPGPVPTSLDGLMTGYELRARLRPAAASKRIACCGARVFEDPTVLTEEFEDGTRRARWTGITMCGRSGCPVCGAIKARRFHQQVLRTLQIGGLWQHVIVTVPHEAGESWDTVYWRVIDGVRSLTKGQCGRVVTPLVEATIRATETTYSTRHGWHVHCHLLWKLRRPLLAEEMAIVATEWSLSTRSRVEYGVRFGASFSCDLPHERMQAADYVSKLALEMGGASKIAHAEHWSLGELYHRAARGEWIELVKEYQEQTRGKRLYQLDRRAKAMHDDMPELAGCRVVRWWTTLVDRVEFSALARRERWSGEVLAVYLPLETAARCRGDPRDQVEDTIYALICANKPNVATTVAT